MYICMHACFSIYVTPLSRVPKALGVEVFILAVSFHALDFLCDSCELLPHLGLKFREPPFKSLWEKLNKNA